MFSVKCNLRALIQSSIKYADCVHTYSYEILACTKQQRPQVARKHFFADTKNTCTQIFNFLNLESKFQFYMMTKNL